MAVAARAMTTNAQGADQHGGDADAAQNRPVAPVEVQQANYQQVKQVAAEGVAHR